MKLQLTSLSKNEDSLWASQVFPPHLFSKSEILNPIHKAHNWFLLTLYLCNLTICSYTTRAASLLQALQLKFFIQFS